MKKPLTRVQAEALYDTDFFEWTEITAEGLREGRFSQIDLEHVAEEIADMGKRDRRELRSRAIVLIQHLIKWHFQPERRDNSTCVGTIREQRKQLRLLLEDSPSLGGVIEHELPLLYMEAADEASQAMGSGVALPSECPFTVSQILSRDWLPE